MLRNILAWPSACHTFKQAFDIVAEAIDVELRVYFKERFLRKVDNVYIGN